MSSALRFTCSLLGARISFRIMGAYGVDQAILFEGKPLWRLWCRDDAQLLHQAHEISLVPAFHDCAADNAIDRDAC